MRYQRPGPMHDSRYRSSDPTQCACEPDVLQRLIGRPLLAEPSVPLWFPVAAAHCMLCLLWGHP